MPFEVLGRAVTDPVPFVDDDFEPEQALVPAEPEFGPSDVVDSLLPAHQVPTLAELFTVPRLAGLPIRDLHMTQVFPTIGGAHTLPDTQLLPVVPSYEPLAGELPVLRRRPAMPYAPVVDTLPDLPPVPTLPAMPHIDPPPIDPPPVRRPLPQRTAAQPAMPDVPPGAAAQLMAQLRGLISELESAGGRDLHPMDVTAWHEPPR